VQVEAALDDLDDEVVEQLLDGAATSSTAALCIFRSHGRHLGLAVLDVARSTRLGSIRAFFHGCSPAAVRDSSLRLNKLLPPLGAVTISRSQRARRSG